MRDFRGVNHNAFADAQQRAAIEAIAQHLKELTAAAQRISQNKQPSVRSDEPIA